MSAFLKVFMLEVCNLVSAGKIIIKLKALEKLFRKLHKM